MRMDNAGLELIVREISPKVYENSLLDVPEVPARSVSRKDFVKWLMKDVSRDDSLQNILFDGFGAIIFSYLPEAAYDPDESELLFFKDNFVSANREYLSVIVGHELTHAAQFAVPEFIDKHSFAYDLSIKGRPAYFECYRELMEGHATFVEKCLLSEFAVKHVFYDAADCSSIANPVTSLIGWGNGLLSMASVFFGTEDLSVNSVYDSGYAKVLRIVESEGIEAVNDLFRVSPEECFNRFSLFDFN